MCYAGMPIKDAFLEYIIGKICVTSLPVTRLTPKLANIPIKLFYTAKAIPVSCDQCNQ